MKQSSKAGFYAIVAGIALALSIPAAQAHAKGCSNATLKGAYADKDTGWIDGIGAFVGVNLDNFDGNGTLTMTGWASLNGTIVPNSATGTYTVNSDCTGTYSVGSGAQQVDGFLSSTTTEMSFRS